MDLVIVTAIVSFLLGAAFGIVLPKRAKAGLSSLASEEFPEEPPAESLIEPPTHLVFSKHFFAEDQGGDDAWRWFIFELKGRAWENCNSHVFKVESRDNAIALMARLDQVEGERDPSC